MKLKIDVKDEMMLAAVKAAEMFSKDYPDRVGVGHCCIYQYDTVPVTYLYVYRTKTGTIVVRQN